MIKLNTSIRVLFLGLLLCNPIFANEQEKLNNIAMGVLSNISVDVNNIVVLDAKPLEENNTILQIAYKDLINGDIKMVYAVDEKTIIANGVLITGGKVKNDFIEQIERVTPIKEEILKNLAQNSIKINDKRDNKKEELFIALSPNSTEFDFLFNSNHYLEILEKYNMSIILVNENDKTILTTSNFIQDNLDIKTIKNILKNADNNQSISDTKIDYLNNIKNILKSETKLNNNEQNGITPIYFINNKRINPNKLINSLNTTTK